jgi:hypothetical protein
MFTEPLKGWRRAEALNRRTAVDWAHQVKRLFRFEGVATGMSLV